MTLQATVTPAGVSGSVKFFVNGSSVGVATLATFGGTGLYDAHHLKQTCMSYCAPDDVDAVRTKLVVADVGLAVAVISLAVGLYLHGKAVF